MINAVILAAGTSSRMQGENKLLMPYRQKTIIQSVTESILGSKCQKVIVVLGHQHDQILKVLEGYPVEFIFNAAYRRGQTSSIQASMSMLGDHAAGFMVCLGDMPLLTSQSYDLLIDHFFMTRESCAHPIVRPVFKNSVGHPVLFDIHYREEILAHDEPDGCKSIIRENRASYHPLDVNTLNFFFDIDNPDDYRRLIISSEEGI